MSRAQLKLVEAESLPEVEAHDESLEYLPLAAQLGSLLFVSARPLGVQALAEAAKVSVEEVEEALLILRESFSAATHGVELIQTADAWQLRTPPALAKTVERLIPQRSRRLSRAAAETLAVIAYQQPVQKAEVEAIRGVDATPTLKTLLDAKLIRIVGRAEAVGHPALYGTTQKFLEKFGLRDLSELPSIREIEEFAGDPGEVTAGIDSESDAVFSDAVSPDAVSPDAVSPDAVSPDAVSPDAADIG